jgi:dihydropteroate synthase
VYRDTVREVHREIQEQIVIATAQGVDPTLIIVDPGIGFAKEAEHNWELLRSVDALASGRAPILVGASRKRFLGSLLAGKDGAPREVDERDTATAALSALLAFRGIWGLRVHDVRATVDAVLVARALRFED